jgi:tetratricopeptide (TPR) repeat protein
MVDPAPRAASWLSRLGWLGVGSLLTLAVAEAGFRLAQPMFDRTGPPSADAAATTVLCEGDSFTYGIGGEAYPQQLDRILDERAGGDHHRVVNKGIPGLNTTVLADQLEAHIDEYKPDVVVVLIGENNSWNTIQVADADESFGARLDSALMHSRVYKFLRVAIIGVDHTTFHEAAAEASLELQRQANSFLESPEKIGLKGPNGEGQHPPVALDIPKADLDEFLGGVAHMEGGRYPEAIAVFESVVAKHPDLSVAYGSLGASLMRQDRLDEAIEVLRRGTQAPQDAYTEEVFYELGSALTRAGKPDEAIEAWTQGLSRFPESRSTYWALARTYQEKGDLWGAIAVEETVPGLAKNPMHQYLKELSAKLGGADALTRVSEDFRRDMNRIVDIAERRGVKLIFASYPDVVYDEVRDVGAARKIPFIDFRPHFQGRFASREEYISPDRCHCNTAGYALMAEVLANEIQGILSPGKPGSAPAP